MHVPIPSERISFLDKKYWGHHFGAVGYGAWSTGNITDDMVQVYFEHKDKPLQKVTGY
jgi:REP element-mobilizing transposase RayT